MLTIKSNKFGREFYLNNTLIGVLINGDLHIMETRSYPCDYALYRNGMRHGYMMSSDFRESDTFTRRACEMITQCGFPGPKRIILQEPCWPYRRLECFTITWRGKSREIPVADPACPQLKPNMTYEIYCGSPEEYWKATAHRRKFRDMVSPLMRKYPCKSARRWRQTNDKLKSGFHFRD